MLRASVLTVAYRGTPVLTGVDFTVESGSVVGLTGESGAGKTTLVRTLAGLLTATSGAVTIDEQPVRRYRAAIAMVFQSPRTATNPRYTLAQIIAEPARIRRDDALDIAELATRVGLTRDLLDRRPHEVSDGQLQRACVARGLAQRPRYLLCDEPTSMLDAATTASIIRLLTDQATASGVGVLLVSHDRSLLRVCCTSISTMRAGSLT
ncbi:dipeptide/oligopeptide/nickel ABC transporter ATP-binding protein [Nocardia sp. NPDC049220]|uniref:ABC transporter ATP-binding protein n=1 Tax=Nocardia sp. NPDC049220 TaxID=3155273 RepID=UPI0033CD42B5